MSPQARRDKYLALGKTFVAKKDYSRAILAFQNAAQAMPKDAEPYYQLGIAALDSGDIRMGALYLKRAVELNPKHRDAQLKIAELMAHGDENLARQAESRVRELLDTAPVTPEMLNTLAYTELRLGKTADAMQTLEEILAKNPGELTSAILLATAKLGARDMKGAEEDPEEGLSHVAESSPATCHPGRVLPRHKPAERCGKRVSDGPGPGSEQRRSPLFPGWSAIWYGPNAGGGGHFPAPSGCPRQYLPIHLCFVSASSGPPRGCGSGV